MIHIRYTPTFAKQVDRLSKKLQKIFKKKLEFFMENPSHNSLNVEKIRDPVYSFRVNKSYRVLFRWYEGNTAELIYIASHDIYRKIKIF